MEREFEFLETNSSCNETIYYCICYCRQRYVFESFLLIRTGYYFTSLNGLQTISCWLIFVLTTVVLKSVIRIPCLLFRRLLILAISGYFIGYINIYSLLVINYYLTHVNKVVHTSLSDMVLLRAVNANLKYIYIRQSPCQS